MNELDKSNYSKISNSSNEKKFKDEFFKSYNKHSKDAQYNEDWLNDMCDEIYLEACKKRSEEIEDVKQAVEMAKEIIRIQKEELEFQREEIERVRAMNGHNWIDCKDRHPELIISIESLRKLVREARLIVYDSDGVNWKQRTQDNQFIKQWLTEAETVLEISK